MKKNLLLLLVGAFSLCGSARAQIIILDDFTAGTQTGEGSAAPGSWTGVGQVTQSATTITVAGTADDTGGWRALNLPIFDASALNTIAVTAQLDPGNAAPFFNVVFTDNGSISETFSIATTAFQTGAMTTVNIPLGPWLSADPRQLVGWEFGGGDFASSGPAFRMTFDQLALTTTAIPEPSTGAMLAAFFALGFAAWRRRRATSAT